MESVMRQVMPKRFQEEPDLVYALTTMISPTVLRSHGATVHKIIHNPGEFVVTFPQAYHGGFSYGYNCAEAVNFALPNWIVHGSKCAERYRKYARESPISIERLIMKLIMSEKGHTVESCTSIVKDMQKIRDEQAVLRRGLFEGGVCRAMRMPKDDESDGDLDEHRQCYICKHMCCIAGIVCECDPKNIVCLRHHADLCNCPAKSKCFLFWYTMQDIEQVLQKAKDNLSRVQRLKKED